MAKLFFSSHDQVSGRYLIVDEERGSIWVYLTLPNDQIIDKDCFLASRKPIPQNTSRWKLFRSKSRPPQMTQQYANDFSYNPNLKLEDLKVSWTDNGNAILKVNEIEVIFFIKSESKGYSKSILNDGIFGNKWSQKVYEESFT